MQSSLQLILAAALVTSLLAVANLTPAVGAASFVYFGTYTSTKSRGIYVSRFDAKTGALTSPELAIEARNPSFLVLHPAGNVLYACGEVDNFGGKQAGVISAFRIEPQTGRLTLLNQQPSGGTAPCHISLDRHGRALFTANYGNGSVASFPLKPDGSLGDPLPPLQHVGSSVNASRQAGPHAHFILPDPHDRFVLACDLGLDKVLSYRFDPNTARLTPNDPAFATLKPGAGPRHLAFLPGGKYVFVINELDSTITAFAYDSQHGALRLVNSLSTLPVNFSGKSFCAEVAAHPSGRFVFGSNRGHDSIAIFAVDPKTGALASAGFQSTGGKTPRHFALDSSGRWLLAANQDSDKVCVFQVDLSNGGLTPIGEGISVGSPVCALFGPETK